jgi:hypothetical protein
MKKSLMIRTAIFFLASLLMGGCTLRLPSSERFPVPDLRGWQKEGGIRWAGASSCAVILLPDGRYRLFYNSGSTIKSAISADGLTFSPEDGWRILPGAGNDLDTNGAGDPSFIQETGFWRMYYTATGADNKKRVMSATSTDGLSFNKDQGARIDYAAGYLQLAETPTVVKLAADDYKMYFHFDTSGSNSLKGATSSDGLTWTVIPLAGFISECYDPEALAASQGLVLLFSSPRTYSGPEPMDIYRATSTNGAGWGVYNRSLFPDKTDEGVQIGGPAIVRLSGGRYRMYYYGRNEQGEDAILSAVGNGF